MRTLINTLKQKWAEYLLEILVLIIGIYGAFLLDNWNENRKNSKVEKEYITRLIQDLSKDTLRFSTEMDYAQIRLDESKILYDFITRRDAQVKDTIRFVLSLQMIGRTILPKANQDAWNDLISTGNANIIQNKNLYDAISVYYNEIPEEWFLEYIDRLWKGYLPMGVDILPLDILLNILDQELNDGVSYMQLDAYDLKVDKEKFARIIEKIKGDKSFEFETKNIARSHLLHIFMLNTSRESAKKLVEQLNSHLQTL